jgi:hypothetical protein
MHQYWVAFTTLIRTPFTATPLMWEIVPLYFALLLSELTSTKANYRTAIQTGFSLIWAGVQWLWPHFALNGRTGPRLDVGAMLPVQMFFSFLVLALGFLAFYSGLRKRFPKRCEFLGRTRFVNYFMITIFPMQARVLPWTWENAAAICLFALPVWLVLHFGLWPFRHAAGGK